jgi:hypothetical protein
MFQSQRFPQVVRLYLLMLQSKVRKGARCGFAVKLEAITLFEIGRSDDQKQDILCHLMTPQTRTQALKRKRNGK